MRKVYVFSLAVLLIAAYACNKDNSSTTSPSSITVQSSSMADFKAGNTINFFQVALSATPVTVPVPGQNQTWNLSNLTEKTAFSTKFDAVVPDAAFPTATYIRAVNDSFGSGPVAVSIPSKYYYEVSSDGWAYLGKSIPAVQLNYGALGSISFPAQSVSSPTKDYLVKFPLHYNDSSTVNNITYTFNTLLNAPLYFLNNTPGTQKLTNSYTSKVIASGNLSLKGYTTPLPVLIVRKVYTSTVNYFLGGLPAPATLLTAAGLTDNATTTTTYYEYYSSTIGYLGQITMNSSGTAVADATFRKP